MISKNMKQFLSEIPAWPQNISVDKLSSSKKNKNYIYVQLFANAQKQGFIGINGKGEKEGIYLSEKGREAIEEYCRTKNASSKSTWALIIAGLSFLTSAIAIILSILGVQ